MKNLIPLKFALSFFAALTSGAWASPDLRTEEQYETDMQQFAGQPLKVFTRCNLRAANLDCQQVVNGFFIAYSKYFQQVNQPSEAQVQFQLTDEAPTSTEVHFHFGFEGDPTLSVSNFEYEVKVDTTTVDSVALLNKVIQSMAKGMSVFLKVVDASQSDTGLTVVYNTEGASGETPKKKYDGPFYFDLSLNGSSSKNSTNSNSYGSATGLVNYSSDKVGFKIDLGAYQNSSTVPTATGTLKGQMTEIFGSATGFYSFKKRWSVALMASGYTAPATNVTSEKQAAIGVEWNLVPYRINETREIYFRAGAGLRELDLELENEIGYDKHTYNYLFAQVYANWALLNSKANLSVSGSSTLYPSLVDHSRVRGSLSLSYQITKSIRVSGGYNLSYSKKSLTYPKNPDYSNPINSMYLSGASGVSSGFNIGVGITIGNSLKHTRDRRWKGM